MRASRLFGYSPLLLALAASGLARAAADDGLQLNAGLGWQHDDNLLRVPDNDPGYDGQRADSWRQLDLGATFDHLYGRQRIQASVQLSRVNFDHFSQLDYHGKDARATWFWQLGSQFEGKLGATYVELLAPYTDLRTSARNLRVQHSHFFDGAWRMHPRWRARVGYQEDRYSYELTSQRPNNRREQALEAGLDYLPPGGSEIGVMVRRLEGRYVYLRPFALALDDFAQDEYRVRVNWLASAKTTVKLLAGWTARTQDAFGPGRVSGVTGRLSVAYAPTAKTSVDAAIWRDFAPIESSVVSYTLNRGASVAVGWQASAKVRVDASSAFEQRDYSARNALPAALARIDLDDTLRSTALNLRYTPSRKVQIGVNLSKQVRSGSRALGIGAFSSTSVGINAGFVF
ncbi:XrtB/PEP-CTERM-associated polysaccharide biosynthesis outer membrane protein EpsL [Massilia sp. S19_KUP03_FR1]|uniref:XrtB/PEP-CTERM-associated polysaccharide biosynthesis outer membrane protein EpsL n=1 Tax=Massilia sp. S19_KUP03_FR1 TaxID=3025503 RepID=UPI002FCD1F97